ncbi:unnamed protein product [Caenorhabditis bovis]|uniref:Transcription factor AP-2 C-terminal domain-containing protein n=1 Tax=Caenorhabditis bovis TaxID=2654633 RepID=A0A8S1F1M3_9PELO|nr:unnamed protein product [Caenorhabditis bovis]
MCTDEEIDVEHVSDEESDDESSSPIKESLNPNVIQITTGRLSMISRKTRYVITRPEILRRINLPEHLNSSAIAAFLRKPKRKNGGEDMRKQLKKHGIELSLCKRKASEMTDIANDLNLIMNESYPTTEIAKALLKEAESDKKKKDLIDEVNSFVLMFPMFFNAMHLIQGETSTVPQRFSPFPVINDDVETYSLFTHGLGPLTSRIWTQHFYKIGVDLAAMNFEEELRKRLLLINKIKSKDSK